MSSYPMSIDAIIAEVDTMSLSLSADISWTEAQWIDICSSGSLIGPGNMLAPELPLSSGTAFSAQPMLPPPTVSLFTREPSTDSILSETATEPSSIGSHDGATIDPQHLDSSSVSRKSKASCYTCKALRKKCDRDVGGCLRCLKRDVECDYPIRSYRGRRSDMHDKKGSAPDARYEAHRKQKVDTARKLGVAPPRAHRPRTPRPRATVTSQKPTPPIPTASKKARARRIHKI